MAYPNPFTNPFAKTGPSSESKQDESPSHIAGMSQEFSPARRDAMDEDEDVDLKANAAQPAGVSVRHKAAFDKFAKLQATADAQSKEVQGRPRKFPKSKGAKTPKPTVKPKRKGSKKADSKAWSTKRSKAKRTPTKRSNSVPRNNGDTAKGNVEDFSVAELIKDKKFVVFNDFSSAYSKSEREKTEQTQKRSLTQKTDQFDALDLEPAKAPKGKNGKQPQSAKIEIHSAQYRSIRVPKHRMIHVRRTWQEMCEPVVKRLKLQIRMNSRRNVIELRSVTPMTEEATDARGPRNTLQKGSDFIRATVLGFAIKDSLALIRMDDIYLESFDIRDVKMFQKKSDHWMRAIGRIAGQYGKIKYSIENSTNTRIIIFGFKVHVLGSFASIRLARSSISRLVMGSAPGNVYAKLRTVSNRLKHKF